MSEDEGYIPTPIAAEEHYPTDAHDKNVKDWIEHERSAFNPSVGQPIRIEPIPWASLDPKLAAGLVKAQAAAVTVVNDGQNSFHKYKYPTQAAIACAARKALSEGGLAILVQGWEQVDGVLNCDIVIIHESGACSPTFSASMPVIVERGKGPDKALAAAISHLRKYVSACVLNMGWADEADVDQRDDRGMSIETKKPVIESKLSPPEKPKTLLDGLRIQARSACGQIQGLVAIEMKDVLEFSTGLGDGLSKSTTPAELSAIVNCASILTDIANENTGSLPRTHSEFINAISQMDVTLEFVNGQITDLGRQMNEKYSADNGER